MEKIKLSKIDKTYIINFLMCDNNKINKNTTIISAITNICVFYAAVYFMEKKSIFGVLFTIINIIILISLFLFLKKGEINRKKIYLYQGIYAILWSISFGTLSYVLFKRRLGENNFLIIVIEISGFIIVAAITYWLNVKKIFNNVFKNKYSFAKTNFLGNSIGVSIVLLNKYVSQNWDEYLWGAFLCGIFAIISGQYILFLMRVYCYSLVGEEEVYKGFQKKQAQKAIFIKYGKKE